MDTGSSETRVRTAPSSHPIDPGGFAPGTILADRYRIVALAGRGGMGEVYRADDLKLGQTVALKFLPAGLEHDASARERLLAEVRSARTVSHPNVCRVYDVGDVSGRVFLTMEYIDGEDLASLLRRIGKLPAAKALEVARQLCAGLSAAHDKGLLHRDLKPANVMIDGRGQARITDFGLALRLADELELARSGQAGGARHEVADVAGTLAYMAPERFEGKPATVQSDLYALGLILYETYTGKPAFKADSFREWQRAHSDSTPTSPAVLASDVEPAVERAILRCLEKDPTRRPKSAAQVAAALPGGDPLAAAIAAGETPSPELVAASGEEGTLPRWQAWAWLAACLVALVAAPLIWIPGLLTEHVVMDLSPDELQARARQTLQSLGYSEKPADSAWWFRVDQNDLDRLNRMRPSAAKAELLVAVPGPIRFCYRQSRATLVPLSVFGSLSAVDPPAADGDVYVELDLGGRLTALRVRPAAPRQVESAAGVNWSALFAAAHLGSPESFSPATPKWWADYASDAREARDGMYGGQRVHVEAAALGGRPVAFHLLTSPGAEPPAAAAQSLGGIPAPLRRVVLVWFWLALIGVAVLARRNLRLGRADRGAARTLAVTMVVASTAREVLARGSPWAALDFINGYHALGLALFFGLFAWFAYLGLEPDIRRVWPSLLVTSTRLLGGRWRDPLVGRAVLAGALVGLVFGLPEILPIYRVLDLPGGGPTGFAPLRYAGAASYLAGEIGNVTGAATTTIMWLTILLVVRLVARRASAAWVVLAVLLVGWNFVFVRAVRPATIDPPLLLGAVILFSLLLVWVLWKHGALAMTVAMFVSSLVDQGPWTVDASRWYAWRGWFEAAVIVALVFWGFKNVLGKQSVFPAGALDG